HHRLARPNCLDLGHQQEWQLTCETPACSQQIAGRSLGRLQLFLDGALDRLEHVDGASAPKLAGAASTNNLLEHGDRAADVIKREGCSILHFACSLPIKKDKRRNSRETRPRYTWWSCFRLQFEPIGARQDHSSAARFAIMLRYQLAQRLFVLALLIAMRQSYARTDILAVSPLLQRGVK